MTPLFSILCGSRNCEKYIYAAIDSVLKQTYSNWELLISDDCSEDKTFEVLSQFKDQRIKIKRNEKRLHCGKNYAQMLQEAQGEFCGVLDGDDMLKPNAIETVMNAYIKYPKIDFIWTKHIWCNGDLTRQKRGISNPPSKKSIYDSENGFKHVYSHWRTFKTDLRNKTTLFKDQKCTVDKELGYSLEEVGIGGFLPVELYIYRYHKHNMSHSSNQKEVWGKVRKRHAGLNRKGVMVLEWN